MTRRTLSTLFLLASLLGTFGCKFTRKKPDLPPQAQAPSIGTKSASTNPGPTPPATTEPSRPLPTPGEIASDDDPNRPAAKPKPRVTRKTVPPGPAEPKKQPTTTVVQNAGTNPPATGPLTASISHDDALHQKLDTAQLIEATETNLRSINRSLSSGETAMVQHIRSYIKDAQNATNNGDYERAYNLALKAHLLSDELAKK